MKWIFEKFKGNMDIYQFCPKCNYSHAAGTCNLRNGKGIINRQYHFCPMCGEYLYIEDENIDVRWNERDITDLLESTLNQKENI
jgi:hypothetical protein